MKTLSIDIETYSSVDLAKCGVYKYSESPDFKILLFAYAVDDGSTMVVDIAQGEKIPEEIISALSDIKVIKYAFNAKLVSKRLVEGYAMSFARFIQCEEAISKFGLVGKHPTTGAPIASPFVSMSQSFQKQANLLWYEIFNVVKANSTTAVNGNPQDDIMEALLSQKGM